MQRKYIRVAVIGLGVLSIALVIWVFYGKPSKPVPAFANPVAAKANDEGEPTRASALAEPTASPSVAQVSQAGAGSPTIPTSGAPTLAVGSVAGPSQSSSAPAAPSGAASQVGAPSEAAATRRMYGAHAPLRTPAVANPDSEQNRQILQTMVEKALVRAAASKASTGK